MSTSTFDAELEKALKTDCPFVYACANFSKELVMTVLTIKPVDIHAYDELAFRSACAYGHKDTAEWLIIIAKQTGKPINIHANANSAFHSACMNGHLEVAKWLYDMAKQENKPIIIHADYAFDRFYKDVKEWLQTLPKAEEKPSVVDTATQRKGSYDETFITAWTSGNFDDIKWAWDKAKSEGASITTKVQEEAFSWACQTKQFGMAKWLYDLAKGSGPLLKASIDHSTLTKVEYCNIMMWLQTLTA